MMNNRTKGILTASPGTITLRRNKLLLNIIAANDVAF